jgi:2-methylaconitate cis-trans-isomerase PrpF
MKRLLLALFLLWAAPALAQNEPVTFRPLTGYTITSLTTTPAGTNSTKAFESQTRWVRALCTVACHIAFMVTPINTAISTPVYLPAGIPEYFVVSSGGYVKVRADSTTGTLYITEMGR